MNDRKRFYAQVDEKQLWVVRNLLRQTSNLWSCLVAHVGDDALAIALSTGTRESRVKMIRELIEMAYKVLIEKSEVIPHFKATEYWEKRIYYIRQLPKVNLLSRVDDLIRVYIMVHDKFALTGNKFVGHPREKNRQSSSSIQFHPDQVKLEGNRLIITLSASSEPLELTVSDELKEVYVPGKSLTLTQKRPSRSSSKSEMPIGSRSPFYVTLGA